MIFDDLLIEYGCECPLHGFWLDCPAHLMFGEIVAMAGFHAGMASWKR